jgi:integrase
VAPEQLGAFLDFLEIRGERLALLFHVKATFGLRRGEVVGLRWSDIDLQTGTLHVSQSITQIGSKIVVGKTKTRGSVRVISMDVETTELLRAHRRQQLEDCLAWGEAWGDTGLVFVREDGSALSPDYVSYRFEKLVTAAKLPPIPLKNLRHTSASLGLASGETLKEVSERLGHSTITITRTRTRTYCRRSPGSLRNGARRWSLAHPVITP